MLNPRRFVIRLSPRVVRRADHAKCTTESKAGKVAAGSSIGFGAILAIMMSWTTSKSLGWAILHGLLGWFYVVYYLLTHDDWSWF